MTISIKYLQTSLTLESSFGLWNGIPLYTILSSENIFTGDASHDVHSDLISTNDFTYHLIATRALLTELVQEDIFSGYVMNIHAVNTPIDPPPDLPELVPPDDLPSSPRPFQDAGKRAPVYFKIYYNDQEIWSVNAPEFGDTDEFKQNRELIRSRGNSLINFNVTTWGRENVYEYTFNWLNRRDAKLLLQISKNVLGKKITIVDHLGQFRLGWIINPDLAIAENVRNGFTATLRFQATYA
jgi:hypothetical protein